AFKVIVDSAYSKQYTINKYNLDEKRIEVLKFLPNIRVADNEEFNDIKNIYNIKNDYIFYPAQFWAHKNHMYILKAIKILREKKNIDVDVIFSGSNKGNLDYILNKAKQFGVDDLIHYVGFVPNSQIPYLYKQSLSLVMPTYLGPTNIPPLEAFFYKTPVCYSDKPSFREQVGDAVFYMNLKDPNSLVENIITIKNNKELVDYKVHKGLKIISSWSEESFYKSLETIFGEYQYIRDGWE
ncbi:glycosyltransferase, partial [Amylibacter sp.]|nr:glycosyltransferase [Amylibacter sp.]